MSSSLDTAVTKADILPGLKTDHSLITIHISKNKNPRGPVFLKLNTSFLLDPEYINLIKKTVNEVSEEYDHNDEVNAALLWDTMKMKIRSSSLHYSKKKKTNEIAGSKLGIGHIIPTKSLGGKQFIGNGKEPN